MDLIYRSASPEDVGVIRFIGSRAFKDERTAFGNRHEWTLEEAFKFIYEAKTRILFDEACPLGFVAFAIQSPKTAYIVSFAIDPEHQHKGYGKLLLDHVLEELASMHRVTLHVKEMKRYARRLYASRGFVPTEREKGILLMSRQNGRRL